MRLISVNLPEPYLKDLAVLVNCGFFPSRSEAIRVAVRQLLETDAEIKAVIQDMAGRDYPR